MPRRSAACYGIHVDKKIVAVISTSNGKKNLPKNRSITQTRAPLHPGGGAPSPAKSGRPPLLHSSPLPDPAAAPAGRSVEAQIERRRAAASARARLGLSGRASAREASSAEQGARREAEARACRPGRGWRQGSTAARDAGDHGPRGGGGGGGSGVHGQARAAHEQEAGRRGGGHTKEVPAARRTGSAHLPMAPLLHCPRLPFPL